ncbi:MAG TPA: choice-of-anchor tandem repeat GloVer-containing protein [Rhizomicrobium sp.]|jgi:uncharacterized repeat protein (TIGR03803 family)
MKPFSAVLFAGAVVWTWTIGTSESIASAWTEKVVWSFGGGTDGSRPQAGLIDIGGIFYGTTAFGGASSGGAVFSFDPNTDAEKVLYSFCNLQNCADGSSPEADVTDVNGTLFGTTFVGGVFWSGHRVYARPGHGLRDRTRES